MKAITRLAKRNRVRLKLLFQAVVAISISLYLIVFMPQILTQPQAEVHTPRPLELITTPARNVTCEQIEANVFQGDKLRSGTFSFTIYRYDKLRQCDPVVEPSEKINDEGEYAYFSNTDNYTLDDIPVWFDKKHDYCSGCFVVYGFGMQVVSLKDISMNPKFCRGKVGGEDIEDVINQKEETEHLVFVRRLLLESQRLTTSSSKQPRFVRTALLEKRSMSTVEECKLVWQRADVVCFDVDSTLLKDEGLDELAEFCGVGAEVREWTNKAMGGTMRFRTALEKRMEIIKPSLDQITEFRKHHKILFSDGVQELVEALHARGTKVYLVSGGFHSLIEPATERLNIPKENIFANRFKFYYDGTYAGFDTDQPTSDSGGKKIVAEQLKASSKNLVFVGDGVTDMEAYPPADCFIGYGGNVIRESVREKASWYVMDLRELITALQPS
ncbi:phosphoserine phosphatase-like [Mya arenaria]|uniref:phosphoserine phosphatase-like n=1 Tax=Mya arenaria TaxID=6604 RepID=UPI0022E53636|nr:phosphoserine phosphatase-like [Mya arenaria]